MAWTAPRTWVLGELVSETLLNTHVRDNLLFLKSNPQITTDTASSQVLSGVNGAANAIILSSVVIPSDVGAVYVEAWASQLNTASHQSFSSNSANAVIYDSVAGALATGSVFVGSNSPAAGAPLYIRSADLAWAGTTRSSISFYVQGVNCEGQLQAPMTMRVMRSY